MSENSKMPLGIKIASNIAKVNLVVLSIFSVVFAALFILTNSTSFMVFTIICIIAFVIMLAVKRIPDLQKSAVASCIVAIGVITFIFVGIITPPLSIESHAKWKYPFQRFYVGCYQNVKEPEWFPDFLDDVQSDYSFSYMPAILQGSGSYSVCFATSPERAQEYEKNYSSQATYTIPVSGFSNGYSYKVHDEDGNEKGSIHIEIPKEFDESGTVYVISTNLDWNHHHSSAVIVDRTSGRIGLIQKG